MQNEYVIMGRFGAPFGIRGEIKINAFTDDIEQFLNYAEWFIQERGTWRPLALTHCRLQGGQILARIQGFEDRDKVRIFTNRELAVKREALPDTQQDEYYWADLEGLTVVDQSGKVLGKVLELMNTGANDILVVTEAKRRILIPFIQPKFIKTVDLDTQTITVDWSESDA